MADLDRARTEAEAQLWDVLDQTRAGMLGVEGSGQHMQPMTPLLDREGEAIWFLTHRNTDLVRAVGQGGRAHFCVIGEDHDYHACLSGALTQVMDRDRLEEFWSPGIAAWFSGKDDPELSMLRMQLSDASIWASTSGALTVGWEYAKANVVGGEPDVSVRTSIRFGV